MKVLNQYLLPGLNPNVSDSERIFSSLAGAAALYRATQKKNALPEVLIGSYLLFRGSLDFAGCTMPLERPSLTTGAVM